MDKETRRLVTGKDNGQGDKETSKASCAYCTVHITARDTTILRPLKQWTKTKLHVQRLGYR